MLNQVKSVVYGFSLFPLLFSFVFVGKPFFFERCFSDTYSLALKIQSVASINFRVSARLGRLAQSEIHF
ncbi:hypothetical protein FORC54_1545 [Vibrio vulnificus]|nr:hypothetical protein FORC54_1545 [Vibrio vulnificus]